MAKSKFCYWVVFGSQLMVGIVYAQNVRNRVQTFQQKKQVFQNNAAWQLRDSLREVTPTITVGSYYDSRVLFLGRDFEERQYGITPYVLLHSGSGLYIYGMNNYWSANEQKPARTDLGVGYEAWLGNNFYLNVGYERWFANYGDEYWNKLLTNQLELSLGFTCFWLDLQPSLYYMFGIEKILQTDLVAEKIFSLPISHTARISVKPAILITYATRNFIPLYSEYVSDQVDYTTFRLADYEASGSLIIEVNNLELEGTIHYNVPVAVSPEQLNPFVYYSLHLSYALWLKRR